MNTSYESQPEFISCEIKNLPEEDLIKAALMARTINPVNAPSEALSGILEPQHIAILTQKYWGAGGVKLTVGFTESIEEILATKIILAMNVWNKSANILFTRSHVNPQVRITRAGQGYWSYVGTDILHIPASQPTMCLQGFTLNTPDSEFMRVIPHETFHTCGGPHEHMRRDLVQLLDRAKTIAFFMQTQGWSQQDVIQQVLTPLDEGSLMATPPDQDSIMCYQIPGQCTLSGQPIRGGSIVNASDFAFAASIYPKAVPPISPTPPTPPQPPVGWFEYVLRSKSEIEFTKKV